MTSTLDNCPTCGRPISDVDPMGCETATGQRYCLDHLPRSADPDLFDAVATWTAENGPAR